MGRLAKERKTIRKFQYARFGTDDTLQNINIPLANHQEGKAYFSGKHRFYGYKVEASVFTDWIAAFCSEHYSGSNDEI